MLPECNQGADQGEWGCVQGVCKHTKYLPALSIMNVSIFNFCFYKNQIPSDMTQTNIQKAVPRNILLKKNDM